MIPIIYVDDSSDMQEEFIQTQIAAAHYLPYYIYRISPLKTEISIDQIRAIKKELVTDTPHSRLIVLYQFDTASLEAQNAFLKTLEEKNQKNQFIMLVTDIGRIVPTILSRSRVVSTGKRLNKSVDISTEKILDSLHTANPYSFLTVLQGVKREDAVIFFDQIIAKLSENLSLGNPQTAAILKKALQQKNVLLNNNLNPQLAVDTFLIQWIKMTKRSK